MTILGEVGCAIKRVRIGPLSKKIEKRGDDYVRGTWVCNQACAYA